MCLAPLYRRKDGAYCVDCNDTTRFKDLSPKQIVDRDLDTASSKGVLKA